MQMDKGPEGRGINHGTIDDSPRTQALIIGLTARTNVPR
jgi:hypothetical protein